MNDEAKTSLVLLGLVVLFLALQALFHQGLWGRLEPLTSIPLVDPAFTNTAPARIPAAELFRTGGDTSDFECNVCHELNKPIKLLFDAAGNVALPEEHKNLVIKHGRNNRNNNCYNCHDPMNHESLLTRDGHKLKIQDSSQLCASCHGPTFRDWELGVHGRTSGHWKAELGTTRLGCASCHHPHAPAFQPWKPAPGPHPLHLPVAAANPESGGH